MFQNVSVTQLIFNKYSSAYNLITMTDNNVMRLAAQILGYRF